MSEFKELHCFSNNFPLKKKIYFTNNTFFTVIEITNILFLVRLGMAFTVNKNFTFTEIAK
jgi:hypothetical protein